MKSIIIRNLNNTGLKIVATADVVENGEIVASHAVEARSKDEFDRTVENVLSMANQVQADFESMKEGVWTPPAVPEVVPEPEVVKTADELALEAWLAQWQRYTKAKKAMDALAEAGATPTAEEQTAFDALKNWVLDNRKAEYSEHLTDTI